ncbi:CHAT domain-containing protein [Nostoc sp. B(2019)]|nr:CHAT domain-containing protein [Nostoc sp. B(2019)]
MRKLRWRKFLQQLWAIRVNVWLALLTFFLVTVGVPAVAIDRVASGRENLSVASIVQSAAASSPLAQGEILYQTGQFSKAVTTWQQAVQYAQRRDEPLNQALGFSYLSLAYQKLGNWQQAKRAIAQSLQLLKPQTNLKETGTGILAQVLNTQGSIQLAMGQPEAALETWQQAEKTYAQAKDDAGILGSQINQAQALQTLGLYRRAQTLLEQVNTRLQTQSDSVLKVLGLKSLGTVLQVTGNLHESEKVLKQSLAIAQQLNPPLDTSEILFNLGNTLRALQNTQAALRLYQQAVATAPTAIAQLRAQLNQLSLLIEIKQWQEVQVLVAQIQPKLANLIPSRSSIYAQVNFAASLMKIAAGQKSSENTHILSSPLFTPGAIAPLLATTVQQARTLQDPRAESYALGQLAGLYEQTQQWDTAQQLSQQALMLAQTTNASDIAYRWQWQLGRIFRQKGFKGNQKTDAISAYIEAVKTLQSIRRDLLATNPEMQFSFQEAVEPIYRELVELLVQPDASPENLLQAREVIEDLHLAQLENFFRSACLDAVQQIDFIDDQAAIIYPILLNNRLEVILSVPGQALRHYSTDVPLHQVEALVENLHQKLVLPYTSKKEIQPLSQQVYNWVIQPAETILANSGVKTLVFVLDGALNNIPMSALYDGKQYLIEKYNVALTPGLRLFEPKPLAQIPLKALTAGLTESRHNFESLEFVKLELAQIESQIPSEVLLNQEFTSKTFASKVKSSPFPVVHIATHGQFSSQSENTFILAWDQTISVNQLDTLLQAREESSFDTLELLVLSACETAAGDERAALGLAGVAVRAGARSTLASLWLVDDESTALLMGQFYQGLKTGLTKAEALRHAQLTLLQGNYSHPRFWSAFVLLGNWL